MRTARSAQTEGALSDRRLHTTNRRFPRNPAALGQKAACEDKQLDARDRGRQRPGGESTLKQITSANAPIRSDRFPKARTEVDTSSKGHQGSRPMLGQTPVQLSTLNANRRPRRATPISTPGPIYEQCTCRTPGCAGRHGEQRYRASCTAGSSTHRAKSAGPTLLPHRIVVTRRPANRSGSSRTAAMPSAADGSTTSPACS
jgi:hypothetical protein